jgi:hypothetical protein
MHPARAKRVYEWRGHSGTTEPPRSAAARRDPQPIPVGILDIALPPRETLFVDGDPELSRYGVDVVDIQVDKRAAGASPSCSER